VWHVPNGDHALSFLRQELPFLNAPAPALIFLDLHIPGRDGYEVLAALRTLESYRTTPIIIIISGSGYLTEEARSLELGANAYVQKSSDLNTYFGSVQAVMGKWLGAAC
jgi:CheY-like chemotaxis protein